MITLPCPNSREAKPWDLLVASIQEEEVTNLRNHSLLQTDSHVPPRHRLFNNMRSLVFVGGNGAGKSQMIDHLYKSLPKLNPLLEVVKVTARRDLYEGILPVSHLTARHTLNVSQFPNRGTSSCVPTTQ